MLFNRKANKYFFFILLILFISCTKKETKEDYIARVNDSYLTGEEFSSLVDTSLLDPENRNLVIRNWINRELLYQKAVDEGLLDEDDYNFIIEKSSKELASAIVLQNYIRDYEIDLKAEEVKSYYEKNKNYFLLTSESYLINQVQFNDEEIAIQFRSLVLESDWQRALNVFGKDTSLKFEFNNQLKSVQNIYPAAVASIVKYLSPQEISIVISDQPGYYNLVQLLEKYNQFQIPPFEVVKDEVEKRYRAELTNMLIENYLKELYSNNEIEIKNRN